MPEKPFDDVVQSALLAIHSRQSSRHKAVSWLRVRPSGPTDLTIGEIAAITGFSRSEVGLLDDEYWREVAEMGRLLLDFVDRADRILAFRRLLESFDGDIEVYEATEDELLMSVTLCQVLVFLSHRGAPLIDVHTRADLRKEIQSLLSDGERGERPSLASLRQLRASLGLILEMATPEPLVRVEDEP